jgi:DNA primase
VLREPIRQAVRRTDTALQRAGRIVIRLAAQDAGILQHFTAMVPLEGVNDAVQREILTVLQEFMAQGKNSNDTELAGRLSEAAMAEFSRAMVEDLGVLSETEAYSNAVRVLRKAYLNMCYVKHSQRAAELARQGDAAYVAELNQAQKIKSEMEELQFE